jgi:hypothetical protein
MTHDKPPRRPPTGTEMTRRLTTPSNMAKALDDLLGSFKRYTILISRPSFIWATGQKQEPNIVLFENDGPLVREGKIDSQLLTARQITIIATAPDNGTVKVDLTARTLIAFYSTPDITRILVSFKAQLLQDARSKWITAAGAWAIIFIPLLAIGCDLLIDAYANPRIRHDFVGRPQGKGFYAGPDQIGSGIAEIIGFFAILAVIIAIAISLIVARSGPLRIWPDAFTADAFQQIGYKLRNAVANNAAMIVVGVCCAVIGAIITAVLTR